MCFVLSYRKRKAYLMEHPDHVKLIQGGVPKGGIWADLGSGRGAFTLALAECLGTESQIYSVDLDRRDLDTQKTHMEVQFPKNQVTYKQGDFTRPLDLPPLDGILMANSLHFIRDKKPFLKQVLTMLKPKGRLLLVEYDTNEGNAYVPHPLSFTKWQELAKEVGFAKTELVATRPSSYLIQFFSAVSYKTEP
jgi:ubiquinone/menaquinone biosynthesis C-methylase UbiE